MAINQLIAAGIQQPRFESPLNMMAQLSQLEAAREGNQLRRMQAEQLMRQREQENALAGMSYADLSASPEMALRFGAPGRQLYGELLKGQRERRQAEQAQRDAEFKALGTLRFALADVNSQESYDRWRDLVGKVAPNLKSSIRPEYDPKIVQMYQVDADKRLALVSPKSSKVDVGDRVIFRDDNPNSPTFGQELGSYSKGAAPESASLLAQRQAATAASQAAGQASGARLAQIQQQMGVAARAETAPKPTQVQLGDRVVIVDLNPQSPTFNQQMSTLETGARPLSQLEQQRTEAAIAASQAAAGASQARTAELNQRRQIAERVSTAPKPARVQLGDRTVTVDDNPLSPTFGQQISTFEMGARPAAARTPEQTALDEARAEQTRAATELSRIRADTERMRQQGALPGDKLAQERIANEQRRLDQAERNANLAERRVNLAAQQAERAADPNFQFAISNARARGAASAKSDRDAQDNLPSAIAEANRAVANLDAMIGRPEVKDASGKVVQAATRPHPGFQNVVGFTFLPGLRFVPGTPAADFYARFQQTQGQSFLQAYETLRGGGHISNTEGDKATAAISRMSIAQSEKEFITAARELQEIVRTGAARAQKRLESIGAGAAPAAAPAAAPSQRPPVTIKSDAEYNSLPSGALFIGPDGKTRRKP